ncbi:MAG: hypothetical protein ACK2U5_13205 [Candidatus Promineifilaceae bacterium]|jgi:hypothetical protein
MITWVRTANVNNGMFQSAMEWALRASAYVNEKYGTNVSVHVNVAGPVNQLRWVATYESLTAFESVVTQLATDEGYSDLLAETGEAFHFAAASVEDAMYRMVG